MPHWSTSTADAATDAIEAASSRHRDDRLSEMTVSPPGECRPYCSSVDLVHCAVTAEVARVATAPPTSQSRLCGGRDGGGDGGGGGGCGFLRRNDGTDAPVATPSRGSRPAPTPPPAIPPTPVAPAVVFGLVCSTAGTEATLSWS